MKGLPLLEGARLLLTPFQEQWAPIYARWLDDPYIQSMAGEASESVEQVLMRHKAWADADDFIEYIIVDKASGIPIGDVSLNLAPPLPVRFGIMIAEPEFRGTGRAQEAAQALLAEAARRGLTRIRAEVYDHNQPSLSFHLKLGFRLVEHDHPGHQWILELQS